MTLEQAFQFITSSLFFSTYCKGIRNWKHKLRGTNGRGNPVEFSEGDLSLIAAGLEKFAGNLVNLAKRIKK